MTRPLTILQILPALVSGGVERGTIEVATYLKSHGHNPLVASTGGRLVTELEAHSVPHFTLPLRTKNPFNIWANAARLEKLIKEQKVDLIHARSRAPAWSALIAARRTGIPFVTTYHSTYKVSNPFKKLYASVMAKGDRVIAISQFIFDTVRKAHDTPPERITLIHRGFNRDAYNPAAIPPERTNTLRQDWKLPAGIPLILCPGRITARKGQDVLLRALCEIKDIPFHCLIAGDDQGRGNFTQDLRDIAAAGGITDRLTIVGYYTDPPALMALADVVVTPSTVPEAFGRVTAEAQAMEKLVVSTDNGASGEIVENGETGWLVAPNDVSALAAALRKFFTLESSDRRRREIRARERALARFSTEKMCRETLEVYQALLQSREIRAKAA